MNEILKKLALSLIKSQLKNPATKQALFDYVNSQVNGLVDSGADRLAANANPFLTVLAVELKTPEIKAELDKLVDTEFEALLAVVLAKL